MLSPQRWIAKKSYKRIEQTVDHYVFQQNVLANIVHAGYQYQQQLQTHKTLRVGHIAYVKRKYNKILLRLFGAE